MTKADPPGTKHRIEAALDELRRGRMVLVVDDEDRENEGDLIMAAELATPTAVAFIVRHTTGLLCVALPQERTDALDLPLMVENGDDPRGTRFTVSVDLREHTTTGVSASDRALTIRALADPRTHPDAFTRPGHVFPLQARRGGVLRRSGHTESAVDLCRLAGLQPAGLLAEVTNDDGTMARRPDLERFAAEHGLVTIDVADIVRHRLRTERLITREATGRLPLRYGTFEAISYRSHTDDCVHIALVLGEVDQRDRDLTEEGKRTAPGLEPVLVRVHSECLTGDVFGSQRCDCGEQLERAIERIGAAGRGVVVYLRGQEGRGIGISHKLRAYELQDTGLDTVDANLVQGLPVDSREYGIGAQILHDLGVREIRLMTNNPAKYRGLAGYGIRIAGREPLIVAPNDDNLSYLETKRTRLAHALAAGDVL